MITYVEGNLFTSPAKVLVNTVNTQGVMGKGIALQFKKTYPEMFKKYQKFCELGKIDIGVLWLYKTPHKWVLNFPTKKHWRNLSKVEYIESGLEKLMANVTELGIHSIAFPALGCGNGELDWKETVKPLMERYLNKLPADVFVHPPMDFKRLPEHKDKKEIEKWLRSEPTTLSFSEVWLDLHGIISQKSDFFTFSKSTGFRARIVEEGNKIQIDDEQEKFLVIEAKSRTHRIAYKKVLALWQRLRSHGYLRRGMLTDEIVRELSYIAPIFAELPYVEKIRLAESGGSSKNNVVNKTYTGIQYMAPTASSQASLFQL